MYYFSYMTFGGLIYLGKKPTPDKIRFNNTIPIFYYNEEEYKYHQKNNSWIEPEIFDTLNEAVRYTIEMTFDVGIR